MKSAFADILVPRYPWILCKDPQDHEQIGPVWGGLHDTLVPLD